MYILYNIDIFDIHDILSRCDIFDITDFDVADYQLILIPIPIFQNLACVMIYVPTKMCDGHLLNFVLLAFMYS